MVKRDLICKVILQILLIMGMSFFVSISYAEPVEAAPVCCEKTARGEFCQYVDESECARGANKVATSCAQTSFCQPGCCYREDAGYCYNNYARVLCEEKYGGRWSSDASCGRMAECKVGCCVIGTEAAFITRQKCIIETGKYPDLEVDFREDVRTEQECIDIARGAEKGCCVEGPKNCKFVTKAMCNVATTNETGFFKDKFCSSISSCECAHKVKTGCLPNEDDVYWFDSCGNPEDVKEDCDYAAGTLCGDKDKDGEYSCESLNCQSERESENKLLSINLKDYYEDPTDVTSEGGVRSGESWCLYDYKLGEKPGSPENKLADQLRDIGFAGRDPVGARHYRSICINGQELVETCKDFRQEWCLQGYVSGERESNLGTSEEEKFTEARCIKNRWQGCVDECNTADPTKMSDAEFSVAQKKDMECCADITKRDCAWVNKCVPKVSPGFKFWENEGTDTCGKASLSCSFLVKCDGWSNILGGCAAAWLAGEVGGWKKFEDLLLPFAGMRGWYPINEKGDIIKISDIPCFADYDKDGKIDFAHAANNLCRSYGDCGADYNLEGVVTYGGFSVPESLGEFDVVVKEDRDRLKEMSLSKENKPNWDAGKNIFDFTAKKEYAGGWRDYWGGANLGFWIPWRLTMAFPVLPTAFALLGKFSYHTSIFQGLFMGFTQRLIAAFGSENAQKEIYLDVLKKQLVSKGVEKKTADKAVKAAGEKLAKEVTKETTDVAKNKVAGLLGDQAALGREAAKDASRAATESTGHILAFLNIYFWIKFGYDVIDMIAADTQVVTVQTICTPWQAPTVKDKTNVLDDCEKCNPGYWKRLHEEEGEELSVKSLKRCSEYRCKSFGASCELINKGTEEEMCVAINQYDVNSPIIVLWKDGFDKEFKDSIKATPNGFKVDKEIPIYNKLSIGIETDEPAQCKMSFEYGKRFEDMGQNYFGGNSFNYFHTQQLFYPAMKNITAEGLKLIGGGDYKIYIRCQDAVGNANERDYVMEFTVAKGKDLTAPVIETSSIGTEVYLMAGQNGTDVILYINEPAQCKWALSNVDYEIMSNNERKCITNNVPEELGLYACGFAEDGTGGDGLRITGLSSSPGSRIPIYFKCQDLSEQKNFNTDPYVITFRGSALLNITKIEVEGPGKQVIKTSGEIKTSLAAENVTLRVVTDGGAKLDGSAVCKYTQQESYYTSRNLQAMTLFFSTNGSNHEQPLIPPTGDHVYYVGCEDVAGNSAFAEMKFALTTDVIPPTIIRAYREDVVGEKQFKIEVDEEAECKDSVEGSFDYETEGNLMLKDGNVHTSANQISDAYYIICKDNYGNKMDMISVSFV